MNITPNLATRLLQSLESLHHQVHGCPGDICPHAELIAELRTMINLASAPVEDAWPIDPVTLSAVIPQDPHDLADAVLRATAGVRPAPGFNPRGLLPSEVGAAHGWFLLDEGDEIRSTDGFWHPDHCRWISMECCPDVLKCNSVNTFAVRRKGVPFTPPPRLCAACARPLPSTTSAGTNLCDRCSL